jgi:hypothetical protein
MKNDSEMAGNPNRAAPCGGQRTAVHHITQEDVALRWNISSRTLERWRHECRGPAYLKMGGRVVYRLCDIEAYEAKQLRISTLRTEAGAR